MPSEPKEGPRDLLRLGDLDGALRMADEALTKASNPWPYRVVLLEIQRLRGQREEALQELEHLELVDPPPPRDSESRIGIRKLRGYYAGLLGRYTASHSLLREAEQLARDAKIIEALAEVLQCQAMIYFLQHNYAESERIFRIILDLSQQIRGWYFRGNAFWGIGKNLMIQTHYEHAMPWLGQALQIFEGVGARLLTAAVWEEMAVCELGLGNDQTSLDLLRKAEVVQLKAGTPANYQVVLANIGNVYLYRGDFITAVSYYQHALGIAREIKDPVSIRKWTYNTTLAYMKMRAALDKPAEET